MKKNIINPYDRIVEHKCFACSKHNIHGLHMTFYQEDDFIVSEWQPQPEFQGYHNVLHGGIQATLMDEISSWCVQIKLQTAGVTSRLETKYKRPVYCDQGKIVLKARIKEVVKNIVTIHVQLFNVEEVLCSESFAKFIIFPREVAEKKFYYPDYESFFEN